MAHLNEDELLRSLAALLNEKNRQICELKSQVSVLFQKLADVSGSGNHVLGGNVSSTCCCACHLKKSRVHAESQTFESDFTPTDSTGSALDWAVDSNKNESVSDILRRVVEKQTSQSDYVFDENYNMYYSPSTGYYYDTERNLLYDPYSQTYYRYDSEKNAYEVYYQAANGTDGNAASQDCEEMVSEGVNGLKLSDPVAVEELYQVDQQDNCAGGMSSGFHKSYAFPTKKTAVSQEGLSNCQKTSSSDENDFRRDRCSSPEEGEIVEDSESMSEGEDGYCIVRSPNVASHKEDESGNWPPCIRAIVKESSQQKIGSLVLITCTGGVVGREESCTVHIPDISISRAHAKITFNTESWKYSVSDLGSQNGTYVNDVRITSGSDGESLSHPLNHGDMLRFGSCRLLVHIHPGTETCSDCEPGLVQAEATTQKGEIEIKTKADKEKERKILLRNIKKKFGLQDMNYVCGENAFANKSGNYENRAETRRKEKGSQNPYEKNDSASVEVTMPSSNKGYKMLKQMGWSEGQSLGPAGIGIVEPIGFEHSHSGRAGLGSDHAMMEALPEDPKAKKWRKAQKRYYEAAKQGM